MPRRSLLLATAAFCGLTGGFVAAPALAEPVTITFLHTNDVYEIAPRRGRGGLAELATLLKAEREAAAHSITTFGGDLLSPSVMSGLTKGAQMIELMNALDTDVAVAGNHEFDFGPEIATERFAASDFPWLAANMLDGSGAPAMGTAATWTTEAGDYTIGFLGVITPETDTLSSPGPAVTFADPMETARSLAAKLEEEGADLIVALTHQNTADDRRLMAEIEQVDIVLGGHDHDPFTWLENGKLLIKAGYDAHYLAAIDVVVDRVEQRGEQVVEWRPEWRFVSTAGVEPEPGIAELVAKWQSRLDEELSIEVGEAKTLLDTRRSTVRSEESAFASLIAEAMRNATDAEIGFTNGGGIRGDRTYEPGTVLTRRDILTELPFGNVTVLMEIEGADVLAALENGVSQVEEGAGRFPQLANMSFTYDPTKPPGERVVEAEVAGEPLDPKKTYTLATNDYIATGGDGYEALTRGRMLIDPSGATLMATTVMNYITAQGGRIAPEKEGRITRVE